MRHGFSLARLALASAVLTLSACDTGPDPGALAGRSVLLVTIDTLRHDRVGFAGYDGAETPALDALAESGVVFEHGVASFRPRFRRTPRS